MDNSQVLRTKVALLTLGCAKNLVDSERIATMLDDRGVEVVHELEDAPVAVVNTCGFIDPAKEESIEVILDAAEWKQEGPGRTLIVTGCLSHRYGDELRREVPEVDVFSGIRPEEAARAALEALGLPVGTPTCGPERRRRMTPEAWSYLRVSHGCSNRCAYCAIPLIRGPLRSREPDEILAEARDLAEQGVRELNVIGQDTAAYGTDRPGLPGIHDLLATLCRVDGLRWIRLLYVHPAHVRDELLDVIASEDKLCPYLDMPLQHINDDVLRRMGRPATRSDVERLIERARERIPDVTLRTTFLVGFPGETEEDFGELLDFVRKVRFDRVGCFAFSAEEGTPARDMEKQVAEEVREEHRDELMAVQQEIAFELAAERVGERTDVLMEEGEPLDEGLRPARSRHEAPDVDPLIYVEAPAPPVGEFAEVEIVDSLGYDCIARIVEGDPRGR
ncbi:MAG: 30S ribosomal protein S12 methylthiotransferase RimO [Candidatus Brocadiia bacterium]